MLRDGQALVLLGDGNGHVLIGGRGSIRTRQGASAATLALVPPPATNRLSGFALADVDAAAGASGTSDVAAACLALAKAPGLELEGVKTSSRITMSATTAPPPPTSIQTQVMSPWEERFETERRPPRIVGRTAETGSPLAVSPTSSRPNRSG